MKVSLDGHGGHASGLSSIIACSSVYNRITPSTILQQHTSPAAAAAASRRDLLSTHKPPTTLVDSRPPKNNNIAFCFGMPSDQ